MGAIAEAVRDHGKNLFKMSDISCNPLPLGSCTFRPTKTVEPTRTELSVFGLIFADEYAVSIDAPALVYNDDYQVALPEGCTQYFGGRLPQMYTVESTIERSNTTGTVTNVATGMILDRDTDTDPSDTFRD